MDKKTERALLDAEAFAVAAEQVGDVDDDTLAAAVTAALQVGREISKLEDARKQKNAAAQRKVRTNTALFKPLIDRCTEAREALREKIHKHLMPTGTPGNVSAEEIRAYGVGQVGQASYARVTKYEYDLEILAKLNPHLLKVDEKAVKALIAEGNMPQGVTPIDGWQLRIQ